MAIAVPASSPTRRPVTIKATPTIAAALPSLGLMRAAEALTVYCAWSSAEKPRWVAASVGAREVVEVVEASAAAKLGAGACAAAGCEKTEARITAPAAQDQGGRSIVVLRLSVIACRSCES